VNRLVRVGGSNVLPNMSIVLGFSFRKYRADVSVAEVLVSSLVIVSSIEVGVVGEVGLLKVPLVLVGVVLGWLNLVVEVVAVVVDVDVDVVVSFLSSGEQFLGPETVDESLCLWSTFDFRKQNVPPNLWPGFSHVQ
jgi:hypothetical protein